MSGIQRLWYGKSLLAWLLWPLSVVFALISGCRRWLYRKGLKASTKPDAFVIIVGNITVGGNGKTPVVLAIVEHFRQRGFKVGVLSRGYGGTMKAHPYLVSPEDEASVVGDEPSLIARRTGVPVVIDPIRPRGADILVADLGCQIIVCDDGLQHYALGRDLELVVMDKRLVGNGRLLPMGPLREMPDRLTSVDALLLNGEADLNEFMSSHSLPPAFSFTLSGQTFRHVSQPERTCEADDFRGKPVSALAGIGDPSRFFSQLRSMGIVVNREYAFADHHQFVAQDLPAGTALMTEKDAVKVHSFAHDDCWYLPVRANFPSLFYTFLDACFDNFSKDNQ